MKRVLLATAALAAFAIPAYADDETKPLVAQETQSKAEVKSVESSEAKDAKAEAKPEAKEEKKEEPRPEAKEEKKAEAGSGAKEAGEEAKPEQPADKMQPLVKQGEIPAAPLNLMLTAVNKDGNIKPAYAFCAPDSAKHTKNGGNMSPELSWTGAPKEAKSFAIIMSDPDVPTDFSDANKEGKTIPADMKRQVFVHWVLVDIDPKTTRLPEGADSDRVLKTGKSRQKTKYGLRGVNDYGKHMQGTFYGYDGPCPPWNDARMHHYTFSVYALDVKSLGLSGPFTAADVEKAAQGHILAKGSITANYTQNPSVQK